MHLSLFQMVSHSDLVQGRMHRCFPQSAASTGWIQSSRSTSSSKTRPKLLDISSLEFYPLVSSSIYPPVAVHVSHNGCRHTKTKLSLSTTIFFHCQQTVQLLLVAKSTQLKQTITPKTALTSPKNVSKEIINQLCILWCVLCVVYHSTVLC